MPNTPLPHARPAAAVALALCLTGAWAPSAHAAVTPSPSASASATSPSATPSMPAAAPVAVLVDGALTSLDARPLTLDTDADGSTDAFAYRLTRAPFTTGSTLTSAPTPAPAAVVAIARAKIGRAHV